MKQSIKLTQNPPGWVKNLTNALVESDAVRFHFFGSSLVLPVSRSDHPVCDPVAIANVTFDLYSPLGGTYWLHGLRPDFESFCTASACKNIWLNRAVTPPFNEAFYTDYFHALLDVVDEIHLPRVLGTVDFFGLRALDYARLLRYDTLASDIERVQCELRIDGDAGDTIGRSRRIMAGLTARDFERTDIASAISWIRDTTGLNIDPMVHGNNTRQIQGTLRGFQDALKAALLP